METKERKQRIIFEDTLQSILTGVFNECEKVGLNVKASVRDGLCKEILHKIRNSSIPGETIEKEFTRQNAEIKEVERRKQILLDKVAAQEKEIEELKKRPAGDFETKEIHALNLKIKELENRRKEGIEEHRRLRYIIDDLKSQLRESSPHCFREAVQKIRQEEVEPLENYLFACQSLLQIVIANNRRYKSDGTIGHRSAPPTKSDTLPDLPGLYTFDGENWKALEPLKSEGIIVPEGGKLGQVYQIPSPEFPRGRWVDPPKAPTAPGDYEKSE